jgi:hypothetical protein
MPGLNALDRSLLQRSVKAVAREMADIGGANSEEMKAAGNALAKAIRKELNTKGARIQGQSFSRRG